MSHDDEPVSSNKMEKHTLSISLYFANPYVFIFHCLLIAHGSTEEIYGDFRIYTLCAIPGYDYFNLTALPWFVSLKHPACVPLPNSSLPEGERASASTCLILMRFCRPLEKFGIGCKNSSICQQSSQDDVSLGAYRSNPFVLSQTSHNEFQASLPQGIPYKTSDGKPCNLKTLVTFRCNQSVKWDAPSSYIGIKRAPDPRSVKYDADTCQMNLNFDYAGACQAKAAKNENVFSIGSVILIVFSISLTLYFVFGCTLNLAKGHSGRRIVPHVTLWTSLIGYTSDGFKFIFCPGVKPVRAVAYEEIKS